ncbi:metal ABC transporter permease [Telmatocola sphagniphila]|uniref:Metal ABC transporter permease n=1 Tax=Telmatocola sphagniphila TaxID=1123043 RepID=A0A8E6B8E6_9BACT|nr:metal ABC transporter permease [Telmatocola sphagniphila]QVL33389.1 metal ABC transporter permease [Telmatocola sphagniphila]
MIEQIVDLIANNLGLYGFEVRSFWAIIMVCTISGMVGSLVVGNRMAFFSDAMAHCAFAGIGLGALVALYFGGQLDRYQFMIPLIMVFFGALLGIGIDYVREKTTLASDTVIGVFFAGAIGFGAIIVTALQKKNKINPEDFLFGSPLFVKDFDIWYLLILLGLTIALLCFRYNYFLLETFNVSLARSRRIPVRVDQILLIVLLAMIVNLSICAVGMLLINAMLIVPAACASNLARNMRQFFWYSTTISLSAGLIGLMISRKVSIPYGSDRLEFGPSGVIVIVCVFFFFASALWKNARDYQMNQR